MATGARRTADLPTINSFTEPDHLLRRAIRNRQICRLPCIRMRPLGRLGCGFHDVSGRSCGTRTRCDIRRTGVRTSLIDNLVDAAADVVGNVKRAVRSNRQAARTMLSFAGRLHCSRETVRKYFTLAGGVVSIERLINHVIAALGVRSAVPGAMEGDKEAPAIAL